MRTRPMLVYDGDCGFCTSCVRFAQRYVRPRCDALPWQHTDLAALGTTPARARHEVLWATPGGAVYGGADAIAKLMLSAGHVWPLAGAALLALPPLRWAAHGAYRVVAGNRYRLPGASAACAVAVPRGTAGR